MSDTTIPLVMIRAGLQNLTIIAALILVYHFIPRNRFSRSKYTFPLLIGIIFAIIATISSPVLWTETDAPSLGINIILIPISAFIGGPLASVLVSAVILLGSLISRGSISLLDGLTVTCLFLLGSLVYFGSSWKWFPRSWAARVLILASGVALVEAGAFSLLAPPEFSGSPFSPLLFLAILPFLVTSFAGTVLIASLIAYIDRKRDVESSLALASSRLSLALDETKADTWEINLATGEVEISDRFAARYGYSHENKPKTIPELMALVHPDDRDSLDEAMRYYLKGEPGIHETVFRVRDRNGDWCWFLTRGKAREPDSPDRPLRIIGIAIDITGSKRSEKALERATMKLNLLNNVSIKEIQNLAFTLSGYHEIIKKGIPAADPEIPALLEKQDILLQKMDDSLVFAKTFQDLGLKPARWQNVRQTFLLAVSHLDFHKIQHTVSTGNLEIFADPLLEQVFIILSSHALSRSASAVHVTLSCAREPDGSLLLVFGDDNPAMPDSERSRLFDPDPRDRWAMRLFLARQVLEITDISLRENGRPGTGLAFEMRVPKGAFRFAGPAEPGE